MKSVIRYSEAFKLKVVQELEAKKYANCEQASKAYDINGNGTVQRWVIHYGMSHILKKVIRVEKRDEISEVKRLRTRVRELEKALADAHLDLKISAAQTQLACEASGIEDVEGFKKKHARPPFDWL
jgi:transposase-like protein